MDYTRKNFEKNENVSNVTTMKGMFQLAISFNQPLNDWNVSNVTRMYFMFRDATSFNQPLSGWTPNRCRCSAFSWECM